MQPSDLRRLMESRFGPIPDDWWRDLEGQDHVGNALRDQRRGIPQLEARIRFYQQVQKVPQAALGARAEIRSSARTRASAAGNRPKPATQRAAATRLDAFATYLAKMLWSFEPLRNFRREWLGGRPMDVMAAQRFLQSPAVRYVPSREMRQRSIPVLHHAAETQALENVSKSPEQDDWRVDVVVRWAQGTLECRRRYAIPCLTRLEHHELPQVRFSNDDGGDTVVDFLPDSILGDLKRIVGLIVFSTPWQEPEATRFALTGSIPRVFPVQSRLQHVRSRFNAHNDLTLYVDPRTTAEEVKRAYLQLQRQYFGRQREPGAGNVELFDFVLRAMDEFGGIPDWALVFRDWNASHKAAERYDHDWRLRRDYLRALELIAFPKEPAPRQTKRKEPKP